MKTCYPLPYKPIVCSTIVYIPIVIKLATFFEIRIPELPQAKNYGICPDWHLGSGGKTWLFVDEIIIN